MELGLTTPSLLFPAISLLLLAYTNRFLAISQLIRGLHDKFVSKPDPRIAAQIRLLRSRLILIRNMQLFGILSLFACVLSIGLIFAGFQSGAQGLFGLSLMLMLLSLTFTLVETSKSVNALHVELDDMAEHLER